MNNSFDFQLTKSMLIELNVLLSLICIKINLLEKQTIVFNLFDQTIQLHFFDINY